VGDGGRELLGAAGVRMGGEGERGVAGSVSDAVVDEFAVV